MAQDASRAVAVIGFETLPRRNRVSGHAGVCASASASPKPSDHTRRSSTETLIDIPGMRRSFISASICCRDFSIALPKMGSSARKQC
jgi:hypothetical protein